MSLESIATKGALIITVFAMGLLGIISFDSKFMVQEFERKFSPYLAIMYFCLGIMPLYGLQGDRILATTSTYTIAVVVMLIPYMVDSLINESNVRNKLQFRNKNRLYSIGFQVILFTTLLLTNVNYIHAFCVPIFIIMNNRNIRYILSNNLF